MAFALQSGIDPRSLTELVIFQVLNMMAIVIRMCAFIYFFIIVYRHSRQPKENRDNYTALTFLCLGLSMIFFSVRTAIDMVPPIIEEIQSVDSPINVWLTSHKSELTIAKVVSRTFLAYLF